MQAFFDSVEIHEPMDPRDAFYGGRTNVRKMYHKCSSDEFIQYIDVTSLYPYVCKYGKFPIGHPEVITEHFKPIESQPYHGLIKCTVIPPNNLLHPVLPTKDSKLMFHLCDSCAMARADMCDHSDKARQFTGTWPTCELYKALEMGYKVVDIIEVYHYTRWSQGPDGMFVGYINSFLKTKQEASGWPEWVKTEDQKDQYICEYENHEGIRLDPKKIEKNPGLRSLSKLCLNSFWGKFGQRSTLSNTVYCTEPSEYYDTVFDETINLQDVNFISPFLVSLTYRKLDDYVQELSNTNCIIAAWVTAQARLKLYEYLEKLQDRVLYMDTDSIIYLTRPSDTYSVHLGDYLGEMTDELNGSKITEFVSCGPKQYGYLTDDGKTEIKIRGLTLNSTSSKKLNFDTLKDVLFAWFDNQPKNIDIVSSKIVRKPNRDVVTQNVKKSYSFVYDKCIVKPDYTCVPYGYTL